MFSRVKLSDGENFRYGLGWWIPMRNSKEYYYHNGITGPEILKIPSEKLDIIILSNLGQGNYDYVPYWGLANKIADNIAESFRHNPHGKPVSQQELKNFIGTYEYQSGGKLEITVQDNSLYLIDYYGKSPLIFLGNHTFILKDSPVIFEFENRDLIKVKVETWNDDFAFRKKE